MVLLSRNCVIADYAKSSLESISTLFMNVSDSGLVPLNILMDLAPAPHKTFNKSLSVFNFPFTPLSPSSLRLCFFYLIFIVNLPFFHFLLLFCCLSSRLFFLLFIHISSLFLFFLFIYPHFLMHLWVSSVSKTKAKCRQKLTCKGTSRQVFIRVYRLEIQSVMLVFSTLFWELLPLEPSLWFNSPPSLPLPCVKVQYTVYGWEGGGGGCWIQLETNILQEFNTLYLTRFKTYNIAYKHLLQIPCTGQFF